MVLHDPLVGRRSHHHRTDRRDEGVVIERALRCRSPARSASPGCRPRRRCSRRDWRRCSRPSPSSVSPLIHSSGSPRWVVTPRRASIARARPRRSAAYSSTCATMPYSWNDSGGSHSASMTVSPSRPSALYSKPLPPSACRCPGDAPPAPPGSPTPDRRRRGGGSRGPRWSPATPPWSTRSHRAPRRRWARDRPSRAPPAPAPARRSTARRTARQPGRSGRRCRRCRGATISWDMSGSFVAPSPSSHSDCGGWKCRPLGADTRKATSAARDGGTPNARRNARENTSADDQPSSAATAATPSPRRNRQAARSSMMRRRSAAGDSPVSRRTSREKWNSEA